MIIGIDGEGIKTKEIKIDNLPTNIDTAIAALDTAIRHVESQVDSKEQEKLLYFTLAIRETGTQEDDADKLVFEGFRLVSIANPEFTPLTRKMWQAARLREKTRGFDGTLKTSEPAPTFHEEHPRVFKGLQLGIGILALGAMAKPYTGLVKFFDLAFKWSDWSSQLLSFVLSLPPGFFYFENCSDVLDALLTRAKNKEQFVAFEMSFHGLAAGRYSKKQLRELWEYILKTALGVAYGVIYVTLVNKNTPKELEDPFRKYISFFCIFVVNTVIGFVKTDKFISDIKSVQKFDVAQHEQSIITLALTTFHHLARKYEQLTAELPPQSSVTIQTVGSDSKQPAAGTYNLSKERQTLIEKLNNLKTGNAFEEACTLIETAVSKLQAVCDDLRTIRAPLNKPSKSSNELTEHAFVGEHAIRLLEPEAKATNSLDREFNYQAMLNAEGHCKEAAWWFESGMSLGVAYLATTGNVGGAKTFLEEDLGFKNQIASWASSTILTSAMLSLNKGETDAFRDWVLSKTTNYSLNATNKQSFFSNGRECAAPVLACLWTTGDAASNAYFTFKAGLFGVEMSVFSAVCSAMLILVTRGKPTSKKIKEFLDYVAENCCCGEPKAQTTNKEHADMLDESNKMLFALIRTTVDEFNKQLKQDTGRQIELGYQPINLETFTTEVNGRLRLCGDLKSVNAELLKTYSVVRTKYLVLTEFDLVRATFNTSAPDDKAALSDVVQQPSRAGLHLRRSAVT